MTARIGQLPVHVFVSTTNDVKGTLENIGEIFIYWLCYMPVFNPSIFMGGGGGVEWVG